MQKLISNFLKKLSAADNKQPISEHDIQLATALLLLEVGQADFNWQQEEATSATKSIVELFSLSQEEAASLLQEAENRNQENISLHPVILILNEHCSIEQKRTILFNCWQLAYADNVLDRYEESNLRKIADLLYLHHADFIQTKLRAEAESRQRS